MTVIFVQFINLAHEATPSNYRGIAITNILGKVFSIILNNRLEKFITSNNLIDDTQIGFKKNCRTSDHMFILQTLIDRYVKKLKSPLYVCLWILEKLMTVYGVRL